MEGLVGVMTAASFYLKGTKIAPRRNTALSTQAYLFISLGEEGCLFSSMRHF